VKAGVNECPWRAADFAEERKSHKRCYDKRPVSRMRSYATKFAISGRLKTQDVDFLAARPVLPGKFTDSADIFDAKLLDGVLPA
jgi:hypothetical protein